jgi:sugar phosphate isomerase/epimerase
MGSVPIESRAIRQSARITGCWIYAISRFGYPPSISDTFRAIEDLAALGFEAIELEAVSLPGKNESNLSAVYAHRTEIRRHCDEAGVRVTNFFAILPDLVSLDAMERARGNDLFERSLEIAHSLGSPLISLDSFPPPDAHPSAERFEAALTYGRQRKGRLPSGFSWNAQWQVLVDTFGRCAELAEAAGLRLAIEPRVGEMIANTDAALRLIDAVSHSNLGIVMDTGHQHAQKEDLVLSAHKLGDRIFFIHISDNDSRDNLHLPVGEGTIDWIAFFTALHRLGYTGPLGIDVGGVPDIQEGFRTSKRRLVEILEVIDNGHGEER